MIKPHHFHHPIRTYLHHHLSSKATPPLSPNETISRALSRRHLKSIQKQLKINYLSKNSKKQHKNQQFLQKNPINSITKEEFHHMKQLQYEKKLHEQRNAMNSLNASQRVCIDLEFITPITLLSEIRSVETQLRLTYLTLKRAPDPVALHLTSVTGFLQDSLRKQGADNWHVHKHEDSVLDNFAREELVYLSPDAKEVLETLDPTKVYVIGGIVDKCIRKYMTARKANDNNIVSYRLPVREVIPSCPNVVLNIDQVFNALCIYNHTKCWEKAILGAVPSRKFERGRRKLSEV